MSRIYARLLRKSNPLHSISVILQKTGPHSLIPTQKRNEEKREEKQKQIGLLLRLSVSPKIRSLITAVNPISLYLCLNEQVERPGHRFHPHTRPPLLLL